MNDFVPNVSKLTLVADSDCLLTEEKLALELRGRGFDLIEFSDPVEFRYAYESKYRSIWDRGEHTDLVVVLRLQNAELESLPYDLLQAGRKLTFNLGDLFPNLSYPVIEKLDRSLLDRLFEAQCKSPPDPMGDNATKDFILCYVFGIAAELITNEVELLRALLRLHYGKLQLPQMLAERLIQVLKGRDGFKTWPLSEIVPDDDAFFAFLQERWPLFLARLGSINQVREDSPEYGLKYPGPDRLPFDHQDIKVYIDNLFLEGKLTPVEAKGIEVDAGSWVQSGIAMSGVDDDVSNVLDSLINPGKTKAVGLVVDKVDKIMHGMQLGSAGMHNQIKQWCQGGFLAALVGQLLEYGYEVWLTADHGNIQCDGKGRPSEGVIAETRGERVRVYPTPELRAQVAGAFPFAHEWQPVGLPADYFPLVASGHDAFVSPGEAIVGHGGIAIEEVIVPLVKFERKSR
nr:BREX-3 system phosphatase PglZ [Eoetvoesiella caeni]